MALKVSKIRIKNITKQQLGISLWDGVRPFMFKIGPYEYRDINFSIYYQNAALLTELRDKKLIKLYGLTEQGEEIDFDSPIDLEMPHNELSHIQGGAPGEYYHLSKTQYTSLTQGGPINLHTHNHENLTDIQGNGPEHIHLNQSEYDELFNGSETSSHTHNHENLTNLQGDGPEHYHLNEEQFDKLTKNQNADSLHHHAHDNLESINGNGPEFLHLNQSEYNELFSGNETNTHTHNHENLTNLQGEGPEHYHLNQDQYDQLTQGNTTNLHKHNHNNLDSIQGDGPEYYHLTENQYNTLTQGNNADNLHTHTKSGITDFNEDDYVHRTGDEDISGIKTFNDAVKIGEHQIKPWNEDPTILEFSRNNSHDTLVFWGHVGGGAYTYWDVTSLYGLNSWNGTEQKLTAYAKNGLFHIITGILDDKLNANRQNIENINSFSIVDQNDDTVKQIILHEGELYVFEEALDYYVSLNPIRIVFNYPSYSTSSVYYKVGDTPTSFYYGYPLPEGEYLIKDAHFFQYKYYTITGEFRFYSNSNIIYRFSVSNTHSFSMTLNAKIAFSSTSSLGLRFIRTSGTTYRAIMVVNIHKLLRR